MKKYYFLAFVITVIAALAIGSNLMITSGRKADQKVTEDLDKLNLEIDEYAQDNNKLPSDLDDLPIDDLNRPISEYEFNKLKQEKNLSSTTHRYELCATFNKETKDEFSDDNYESSYGFYYHKAGRQCFDRVSMTDNYESKDNGTDIYQLNSAD